MKASSPGSGAEPLLGEDARQPRQHGAVVLDVRVGDDRHDHAARGGEHAAQAVGLVGRGRVAMTGGHVSNYVRAWVGVIA